MILNQVILVKKIVNLVKIVTQGQMIVHKHATKKHVINVKMIYYHLFKILVKKIVNLVKSVLVMNQNANHATKKHVINVGMIKWKILVKKIVNLVKIVKGQSAMKHVTKKHVINVMMI